jgi:hypothetical protein
MSWHFYDLSGTHDTDSPNSIAAGIKAKEWNGFHDFILWDEL